MFSFKKGLLPDAFSEIIILETPIPFTYFLVEQISVFIKIKEPFFCKIQLHCDAVVHEVLMWKIWFVKRVETGRRLADCLHEHQQDVEKMTQAHQNQLGVVLIFPITPTKT